MLHATAMVLMIGSAITALLCCLGAALRTHGRAVPWQGCQSACVMALGMIALCAGEGDARVTLLVAASGLGSAMLGVAGTRGSVHARACFHRALGCVAMAACALAALSGGSALARADASGVSASVVDASVVGAAGVGGGSAHVGHGALVPFAALALGMVGVALVAMAVDRARHRASAAQGRSLRRAEGASMAVSLAAMGAMMLLGAGVG